MDISPIHHSDKMKPHCQGESGQPLFKRKEGWGDGSMGKKKIAAEPDNLSLIPGNHMAEREN